MKLKQTMQQMYAAATVSALGLGMSTLAFAGSSDSEFSSFKTTVQGWANGNLGAGLAITSLVIGAGIGVAKNSPMAALPGIGLAAFLKWGPSIVTNMLGSVV